MHDANDMDLLQDYVQQHSETAFAELVQRHIALVYSAALRQTGTIAHAEEITQAVFIILARKAATLRPDTIVDAWLYGTTRLTALSFLRGERRRRFREQEAYMQSVLNESHDAVWEQISPVLDEAVSRLGQKDRQAVVLRYFKEKNLRDVALAMNITEAAAQRRVHRAVDKLRKIFAKHGVNSSTALLGETISANSIQIAPMVLAKVVTAVAIAKGTTASASTLTLIKGALKIMAWTKAKTAVVAGTIVLLATGTVVTIHLSSRTALVPARTTPATESIKGQMIDLEHLVDAGNTTPEAAWETRYWARAMGDYDAVIAATDPRAVNVAESWMGDKATFRERSKSDFASFKGIQISARKVLANDRVELKYHFTFGDDPQTKIVLMVNVKGAWMCRETRPYDTNWDAGSQPEPES